MALSVFDLFKIGIGPSSSHTVGPMKAAAMFARRLHKADLLPQVVRIEARLYGSLGATGKGHGADTAVMLGLEGEMPDTVDPDSVDARIKAMSRCGRLTIDGVQGIAFNERKDLLFLRRETLPFHSNGVRFSAFAGDGSVIEERRYFSVGGGFVVSQEEADKAADDPHLVADATVLTHPFSSGDELLAITKETGLSIAQVMRVNEHAWRTNAELDAGLKIDEDRPS